MLTKFLRAAAGLPKGVSIVESSSGSGGLDTTLTLNWGSSAAVNDYVIVILGGSSTGIPTGHTPSGWTQLFRQTGTDVGDVLACYYRILTTAGAGSVTFASTAGAELYQLGVFRNVSAIEGSAAGDNTGATTSIPSRTVTTADSMILAGMFQDDTSSASTITVPTNYTPFSDTIVSGTSRNMRIGYRANPPIGSTGTLTATSSNNNDSIGVSILLTK